MRFGILGPRGEWFAEVYRRDWSGIEEGIAFGATSAGGGCVCGMASRGCGKEGIEVSDHVEIV